MNRSKRRAKTRTRRLRFEVLEERKLLAFCRTTGWTFEGTDGDDVLEGIWFAPDSFNGPSPVLWWRTNGICFPNTPGPMQNIEDVLTVPAGPIQIIIKGFGGNDTVDFSNAAAAPPPPNGPGSYANMFGFPRGPVPTGPPIVALLKFEGDSGNDKFVPPEGAGGTGTGPVIMPAPGAIPNIQFFGATGNDDLWNMADPEYLDGDVGVDSAKRGITPSGAVAGGGGDDVFNGGPDSDYLDGGPGNDTIDGGADGDSIFGGPGNDSLSGAAGYDQIWGDVGNDSIYGGPDGDRLDGGEGDDFLDTGTSGAGAIAPGPEFESADGGEGDDYITAVSATGPTWLDGGPENDRIEGSPFDDQINGDNGRDYIEGGAGNDTINGGDEVDILVSGAAGAADQPWDGNGVGNPAWFDMDGSGPDNDGDCDVEDDHPDLDGVPCSSVITAYDDSFMVSHSSTIDHTQGVANVLVNDDYIEFGPVTITVTNKPLHGTLTMYQNGTFDYDPHNTFVGVDTFKYMIIANSTTISTQPGIVNIDVFNVTPSPNPDGPFSIQYDPNNLPQNKVTFNVLDNDFDEDWDNLDIIDPDGAGPAVVTRGPSFGYLTVNHGTGEITYTYTSGPPEMMPVSDSFDYKIKDPFSEGYDAATVEIFINPGMPLMLDRTPVADSEQVGQSISNADLALLAEAAAQRWVLAGVDSAAARQTLEETTFVVADLPGSMLGLAVQGTLLIDVNAAGYGWFVDATPDTDEEFSMLVAPSERQAGLGSQASGKADLFTVLAHELGHRLGIPHLDGDEFEHSVMNDTLGLSMRRLPTLADILAADEFYASLGDGTTVLWRRRR